MPEPKLKIICFSMDGVGHISACVGILQPLVARGHDVSFILNDSFQGRVEHYGIREILVTETSKKKSPSPTPDVNNNGVDAEEGEEEPKENISKRNGEMLLRTGILSGKPPLEKMQEIRDSPFLRGLYDSLVDFEPQIEAIIEVEKPDLMIVDHFLMPAVIHKSGIPYAFIHSCSPLLMYDQPCLPPAFSGYPTKSDPETWKPFEIALKANFYDKFHEYQMDLFHRAGMDIEEHSTLVFLSPYLNIYAYPKELDYPDIYVPPAETFFRIDAFSRDEPEVEGEILPESFLNRPEGEGLVYFSLGSMAGADLELMKKLTGFLSESKHKIVVAKGPRADEYELDSPNIYSGSFLPQTKILPHCDLVITHGGNNTTTETLFAGVPLIVFPMFGDQYDNGTRVEETGCGLQFNAYHVTKEQLLEAIDRILGDEKMKQKTKGIRDRILKDQSKIKLAERLERLVREHSK